VIGRGGGWSVADIGDLTGTTALVTGANSGIGFEAAVELAAHGALVVLACRNLVKGRQAADRISGASPGAMVEVLTLDLASQASVHQAAGRFAAEHDRLDLLVNNAGVMGTPYRVTEDGFELQLASNHLGHFALTGLLLELLLTTPGARVVTVSSFLHRMGRMGFDDLQAEGGYSRWGSYGQSKLANLLFTAELERRFEEHGADAMAVAAHPGWARTNLAGSGPVMGAGPLRMRSGQLAGHLLGQSAAAGALPTLYAALSPEVHGGDYIGPRGPFEQFGAPVKVGRSARARREEDARRLWDVSEELTGVHYQFGPVRQPAG
jgi:NAD(P)-dependent dehydrogenase (short-subunit alcohol dehydrogenase family)